MFGKINESLYANDTPEAIADDAHKMSDRDAEWVTRDRIALLAKRAAEKAQQEFLEADLAVIERLKALERRELPSELAAYPCLVLDKCAAKMRLWCPKHKAHHDFNCERCCSPEPDGSCSCESAARAAAGQGEQPMVTGRENV